MSPDFDAGTTTVRDTRLLSANPASTIANNAICEATPISTAIKNAFSTETPIAPKAKTARRALRDRPDPRAQPGLKAPLALKAKKAKRAWRESRDQPDPLAPPDRLALKVYPRRHRMPSSTP